MRRRRNKRDDLIIDLTSLLDIIFIILLVVMCSQQLTKWDYESQEQAATEKVLDAEAAAELYRDQMETHDKLNEYVVKLSVYSDFNPNQITVRKVRILKELQAIETIDLIGADTSDAFAQLEESLVAYIQENSDKPVILSLNEGDEKILYRDEKTILAIFERLRETYTNVYVK